MIIIIIIAERYAHPKSLPQLSQDKTAKQDINKLAKAIPFIPQMKTANVVGETRARAREMTDHSTGGSLAHAQ